MASLAYYPQLWLYSFSGILRLNAQKKNALAHKVTKSPYQRFWDWDGQMLDQQGACWPTAVAWGGTVFSGRVVQGFLRVPGDVLASWSSGSTSTPLTCCSITSHSGLADLGWKTETQNKTEINAKLKLVGWLGFILPALSSFQGPQGEIGA